jgi:hypothetical protein
MKKRAYHPNSRTYTIMLNAYAGARHMGEDLAFVPNQKPSERVWQRVLTVYNESQANIMECINKVKAAKTSKDDLDYGLSGEDALREGRATEPTPISQIKAQINPTPTNAYIKLLARFGMWGQLEKVQLAMDKEGPLSPNTRTYHILFSALMNRRAQQMEKRYTGAKNELPKMLSAEEYGSSARLMWDEAVRRFHPVNPPLGHQVDKERLIDEELALLAMKAFLTGRPMDQHLALSLIPYMWNLPPLSSAGPASMTASMSDVEQGGRDSLDVPHYMRSLPRLSLSSKTATALILALSRANKVTAAATWARHMMSRPDIRKEMDFGLIRSLMYAFGSEGDLDSINEIMETYQPPTGKAGWQPYIWENAMIACRVRGDFESALRVFRRMTHLAYGTEDGEPKASRRKYVWHLPRGKDKDINGRPFYRPDPQEPTAKVMSLLFKAAFAGNSQIITDKNTRRAFNVFASFPMNQFFTIPADDFKRGYEIRLLQDRASDHSGEIHASLVHAAEWRLSLAKDVEKATDLMLANARPEEVDSLVALKEKMTTLVRTWGKLLDGKPEAQLTGGRATLRSGLRAEDTQAESGMPASSARTSHTVAKKSKKHRQEEEDDDDDGFYVEDDIEDAFEGVSEEDVLRQADMEQREWNEQPRKGRTGGRQGSMSRR